MLGVAFFQVAVNLVGLDVVAIEDAPHGTLARFGQSGKACGLGLFANKLGQPRDGPQLGRQAVVFGFGAREAHHPGFGFIGNFRFMRTVVAVRCVFRFIVIRPAP
jgi:hypothetical protein